MNSPWTFFRLPSLQFLSLRYNPHLTGYLPEFQETGPLKNLYLAGTSFSGELPASIGTLGSVIQLDLSSCNLTGFAPTLLGYITQLFYLDLHNNHSTSQIPPSLGSLTQLTHLEFW